MTPGGEKIKKLFHCRNELVDWMKNLNCINFFRRKAIMTEFIVTYAAKIIETILQGQQFELGETLLTFQKCATKNFVVIETMFQYLARKLLNKIEQSFYVIKQHNKVK